MDERTLFSGTTHSEPAEEPWSSQERLAWYAVRVRSNFEKLVAELLHQKGYREFCPTYQHASRWSDRIKKTTKPLFAGYVFCQFDAANRLPILTTPGVVNVVAVGKVPAPIEPSEIEVIRKMVDSGLEVAPCSYWDVGDQVFIEAGPLAGMEGTVIQLRSSARLIVSVSLLRRSVSVEINRDWIRATSRLPLLVA